MLGFVFFIGVLCAVLGAFGGATNTNKNWRRVGIPLVLTFLALAVIQNWWCILIMAMAGALSIGYGIPDPTDSGSTLGAFWYNLFGGNSFLANVFTRGTVGLVVCLTYLVVPILIGVWLLYILTGICILLTYALVSWRQLPSINILGTYFTVVELITYGVLGLGVAITICG